MLTHANDPRTVIIAPAVVAAALDCLAVLGDLDPVKPAHMHLIATALGCREPEATALTLRLMATAAVLNDDRWLPWSQFYKRQSCSGRRIFDRVLMQIVAGTPLDHRGRFDADVVFDDLLHILADPGVIAASGGTSSESH